MVEQSSSLYIVEDNPADMTAYLRLLEDIDHNFEHIVCLSSLEATKKCLLEKPAPSCCLLDFSLPDGSALSLLEELESTGYEIGCPIIVITGQDDTKSAVKLLKLGIQDYLIKDELSSHHLIQTINSAMQKWQMKKQLEDLALLDSMTGIANRRLFMEKLEQTFAEAQRYSRTFSLLVLDVDKFKSVNDIYGHDAGDFVLKVFTQKVLETVRSTDFFGRLGGDEFAVILMDIADAKATKVANKIQRSLCMDVTFNNSIIPTGTSIGLTSFPSKASDASALLKEADIALYKAKESGRNKVVLYKRVKDKLNEGIETLRTRLPDAIANDELQLAYQGIFCAQDRQEIYAIEALVRWNVDGKWVNPVEIINMVMEQGLDISFHEWLLKKGLKQLMALQIEKPQLKLNLNLPANLCHNPLLANLIVNTAKQYEGIEKYVVLEVTETHLMTDPSRAKSCLRSLVDSGFEVAIDDFGTGYSSMEYLADFPCSIVKIDKRFFLELQSNAKNHKIIEAISALAHSLDMKVVAEGIETEALVEYAKQLNCDYLQGFFKGKPIIAPNSLDHLCGNTG